MFWQTTRHRIDLSAPRVMGIVNVTPDSFADGGRHDTADAARRHCDRLVDEGADLLDIGGESSRPGAPMLAVDEEWRRIEPVLRHALTLGVPVSVDTWKAEVMLRALDLGVDIINDIHALTRPGSLDVVVDHGRCGVCLMHMRGDSATMQTQTEYADVVHEVTGYLRGRKAELLARGVQPARLALDPGIGFAKTPAQNLALLKRQSELAVLELPLLIGWSRKSTLGVVAGREVHDRLAASLAAALLAAQHGAAILRVHDVAETVDVLKVWQAVAIA